MVLRLLSRKVPFTSSASLGIIGLDTSCAAFCLIGAVVDQIYSSRNVCWGVTMRFGVGALLSWNSVGLLALGLMPVARPRSRRSGVNGAVVHLPYAVSLLILALTQERRAQLQA